MNASSSHEGNALFNLSAEDYLQHTGIPNYLQEIVDRIQITQPNNPMNNIAMELHDIRTGQHVIGKHFVYLNASELNKCHFLQHMDTIVASFSSKGFLGASSLAQLFALHCNDFPIQMIKQTFAALEVIPHSASTRLHFQAIGICWWYYPFLKHVTTLYQEARQSSNNATGKAKKTMVTSVKVQRICDTLRVSATSSKLREQFA